MAPAPITGKRKRPSVGSATQPATTLQIVTGSYERVLHGFTVAIPPDASEATSPEPPTFSDTFLFNAHISSIRCLALSPPSSSRLYLATGSSDERVNVYQLSATAPPRAARSKSASTLLPVEPSRTATNKELGTLLHHAAPITSLSFPTHSKLVSTSLDNNIAFTRTRDWQLLSTIKAPLPKMQGRPSGDTFAPGEVPAGITDLAVHPSARLAVSVGVGEKCMRLWNLVTGKKAGVLVFDKQLLGKIGEGKRMRGGEARTASWKSDGEEFAVGFERGILIYGLDCVVKGYVDMGLRGKVCKCTYVDVGRDEDVLAVSTEDGRILLFDTINLSKLEAGVKAGGESKPEVGRCTLIGQIGGAARGAGSRIKDFVFLQQHDRQLQSPAASEVHDGRSFVVTASSDGMICVWKVPHEELLEQPQSGAEGDGKKVKHEANGKTDANGSAGAPPQAKQLGVLLGTLETGRRVTCMTGFVMNAPKSNGVEGKADAAEGPAEEIVTNGSSKSMDKSTVPSQADEQEDFGGFDESEEEQG